MNSYILELIWVRFFSQTLILELVQKYSFLVFYHNSQSSQCKMVRTWRGFCRLPASNDNPACIQYYKTYSYYNWQHSDWPICCVNKSTNNATCINMPRNAFISSQIWLTSTKKITSYDVHIVVKNNLTVVWHALYSFQQLHSSLQWSKFVVD